MLPSGGVEMNIGRFTHRVGGTKNLRSEVWLLCSDPSSFA